MQKFPSLLILGIAMLVIALLQVGVVTVQVVDDGTWFNSVGSVKSASAAQTVAPDENLTGRVQSPADVYIAWPVQPHNPRLGNSKATNQLIIATDTCRPAVRIAMRQITSKLDKLDVVLKYVPTEPAATDSGLLWQLAERAGIFDEYWRLACQRQAEGYDLNLAQQVALLEQAGMSLTEQRTQMSLHLTEMLNEIDADNQQAQALGLKNLPVFILNGRQVMPQGL